MATQLPCFHLRFVDHSYLVKKVVIATYYVHGSEALALACSDSGVLLLGNSHPRVLSVLPIIAGTAFRPMLIGRPIAPPVTPSTGVMEPMEPELTRTAAKLCPFSRLEAETTHWAMRSLWEAPCLCLVSAVNVSYT